MGRINSSQGMEDRKGVNGRVCIGRRELSGGWTAKMEANQKIYERFGFSDVEKTYLVTILTIF